MAVTKEELTEFLTTHKGPVLLTLAVIFCLLFLFRMKSNLEYLIDEQAEQIVALQKRTSAIEKAVIRLQLRQKKYEQRITLPEKRVNPELDLKLLKEGLYILETEVTFRSRRRGSEPKTKLVTIYHIKSTVEVGDFSQQLNLGLVTKGLASIPLFYIDYNRDTLVDFEMMERYAGYLPMGGLIRRSLDPDEAQQAYDAFLYSSHKAQHTSLSEITETSGEMANWLWSLIQEHSEDIAQQIKILMDSGSKPPPSAEESPEGQ